MLLRYYHTKLMHAGPQLLLSTVRLRYWPLGGRNVAREICHQCIRCYRTKPAAIQQFMAELPSVRVAPTRPFLTTGVDYFGPIYVRAGYRKATVKAYAAVFVCFSTKATHLELVTDLSTARFIQALRRFISRRGKCANIHSDNGTNFVGAKNQMKELLTKLRTKEHHDMVAKECTDNGMQWHFIPPGAPHFGGLCGTAGEASSTEECCLNSRPLTQLSDDPGDLQPLTPGHFLVGSSLHALPDEDYTHINFGRLNQWEIVQRRLQDFWKRWRTEYLTQLQGRSKWWKAPVGVNVGRLVVIREDNVPPIRWRMGRIIEIHPGTDGVVRVVSLKTANGIIQRPVQKICLLPLTDTDLTQTEEDTLKLRSLQGGQDVGERN
ncbi:uncharacterized protein LOC129766082 [Toxorhynchites rutilus septentrionalis]|uniref:uncharacterized protein LOC129766082 n=1 Tax=Toxorhynchites rutilus septentrionalis TaxID=329112 RepID=UPI0024784E3B|nr:uncharacterized protein LOC129766082 [Toxorhynchites rutilus septentrionalis]